MNVKHYIFPHHLFQKGERIVIYGAGNVGQEFYQQAIQMKYVRIVGIVDKNYMNICREDFPVQPIDNLFTMTYDYILISIHDSSIMEEVKFELIQMGIDSNKIKWDGKNYSYYDYYKSFFFPHRDIVFEKMERLPDKKTVLVIDWQVPKYDTNAGDRHTFQYLCFFAELGLRTIYLANTYIDWGKYTQELRGFGVEVLVGGEWDFKNFERWIELNGDIVDYTYLNREEIFLKYISLIRQYTSSKVFYYPHDLVFPRLEREYAITNAEAVKKKALQSRQAEEEIINESDVVHVLGDYELNLVNEINPTKRAVCIPIYIYDEKQLSNLRQISKGLRNGLIFVGGFDHRPNVDAMKWFVAQIWPRISDRLSNAVVYIVGSNPPEEIQKAANDRIIVTGYVDDNKLEELYRKSAVCIVPLRYGSGQKGKVIEAMYMGLPLVCTNIAAEGFPDIEQYVAIADCADDFAEKVVYAFNDDYYWRTASCKGREYLTKYLTKSYAKKILRQDMDF